jgi:integrase
MNKPLSKEQVQQLRESLRGHRLEAIITLALVTGMRRDELLHLKWQDVDLDQRTLSVQDTKTQKRASHHLPDDVTEMLKQHLSCQTETQAGLDLVFVSHTGEAFSTHQLMKGFHEILEQTELPRISFHDLRATVKKNEFDEIEGEKA